MPRPRLESEPWWGDLIRLKDQFTLNELADQFDVSVNGLSRALNRAEVKRRAVRSGGRNSRTGPDPRSAEAQNWWKEFLRLKDEHSLAELADQFGVCEITLQRALKRTGVTRASQRGARGNRQREVCHAKIAKHHNLAGLIPDGDIATMAGVSRYSVAQYRKAKGIPSVRDKGPLQAGQAGMLRASIAIPRAPVANASGQQAFHIVVHNHTTGERLEFVTFGDNLADAAQRAQDRLEELTNGDNLVIEQGTRIAPAL